MENAKIMILNLQKISFKDKEGKDRAFCKITYGMNITKTDKFVGYSILESSADDKSFDNLVKYLGKESVANIDHIPTENGIRYKLSKINNESIN